MKTIKKVLMAILSVPFLLISLTSLVQAQALQQENLKIKLVAWDAQTQGAISSSTMQIELGVSITNNSSYKYGKMTVTPVRINNECQSPIYVYNRDNSMSRDLYTGPVSSVEYKPMPPFSTHFFPLLSSSNPLSLTLVRTNYGIVVHADLEIVFYDAAGNLMNKVQTMVEDIVYEPSNSDFIPTIYSSVSNISSTDALILKKLDHSF